MHRLLERKKSSTIREVRSLKALSGEAVALIGSNGSGKSALRRPAPADEGPLPRHREILGHQRDFRPSIASVKAHEVRLVDGAPATGDVRFRKRSEDRMRELRRKAGTVFLVSHGNSAIRDTRDRTIWLKSDAIRQGGPTEEVLAAHQEFSRRPA